MYNTRRDFPFFNQKHYLSFLDSAASSQKPGCVIDSLVEFYSYNFANVHRGIYYLSSKATEDFEKARSYIAKFINARSSAEIVFTKNATEGINLVASAFGKRFLNEGDEIIISIIEHHSNMIPWQQLCKQNNISLKVIPSTKNGQLKYNDFKNMMSSRVKLVAITHMSNFFGSVIDIKKIVKIAKNFGAKVLVDACQSIAHLKIDVQDLNCDFLVFSSHKLYGPTGVGILYGNYQILDSMETYQTGGSMISKISLQDMTSLSPPNKFEAGTPAIAEVIAFGQAIQYLNSINLYQCWDKEKELMQYIKKEIHKLKNFTIYDANQTTSIISLTHAKAHHYDIGEILDNSKVAVRTGHHCTTPLVNFLGITGSVRISLAIYNNYEDADYLIRGLRTVNKIFQ